MRPISKILGIAAGAALLAACGHHAGYPNQAPFMPVGAVDPNANLNSLVVRGLMAGAITGPAVAEKTGRQTPAETVEVVVTPGDNKSRTALAFLLANDENVLLAREPREDGSVVFRFLRRKGQVTPGDSTGEVRIFGNAK